MKKIELRKLFERHSDALLLGLVLLIAAGLRFYRIWDVPFRHDEFSALFRLRFDSLSDLIWKGVAEIEGHPVGVHVFLFYWIKLVGVNTVLVKLPFVLAGIASVWVCYEIGKRWFGKTSGMLSAAFLAVNQYGVYFSQEARPYAPGLLFVLFAVLFLTIYYQQAVKRNYWVLLGFALSSALAAYSHQFSMLQAFITAVAGLFVFSGRRLVEYVAACFLGALFYLPHLPITLIQLQMGGIGSWLGKPDLWFVYEYHCSLFHFSWIFGAVALSIILFFRIKEPLLSGRVRKYWLFSFVAFILPLVIGYTYSVLVDAVLMQSVLLFSLPFLVWFLFAFTGKISNQIKWLMVTAVLITGSYTLISIRKHYQISTSCSYENLLSMTLEFQNDFGASGSVAYIHSIDKINNWYVDRNPDYQKLDLHYSWQEDLDSLLQSIESDAAIEYFVYGAQASCNPTDVVRIQDAFPFLVKKEDFFHGSFYVFSRRNDDEGAMDLYRKSLLFDFRQRAEFLDISDEELMKINQEGLEFPEGLFHFDSGREYGPLISIPLAKLECKPTDYIDLKTVLWIYPGDTEAVLVSELKEGDAGRHWSGKSFAPELGGSLQKLSIYQSIPLTSVKQFRRLSPGNTHLRVYFWNNKGASFYIEELSIGVRKGNPLIYARFDRI